MFDSLIREAASRFHLGDDAGRLVRQLVDAIFDEHSGGFSGLRDRFASAGLDDLFSSWIGTTPGDNVLQPDQFNTGFGNDTVSRIASDLGLPPASVNLAGAWLLPKIVGLLTRGGTVPSSRPAEYDSWFVAPAAASVAQPPAAAVVQPAATVAPAQDSGLGFLKWLIPLLLLVGAFLLFRSCKQNEPVAPATPAATPAPVVAEPATPAAIVPARFGFENSNGTVTVNGQVASDGEKTRLWDALVATFGAGNVNGDIVVDANTAPAGWLDKLIALLPDLKASGLKFGFDGDRLSLDTSGLSEADRFALSEKFRGAFSGFDISGMWDRAMAALTGLRAGYSADDLVKALNLMNVYFDTGSAAITRDSFETLQAAANAIKGAPAGTRIEAGGHTDNTGDAAANMTLSQQRADAVVAKLKELGVGDGILTAKGYGQGSPVADNTTEEGKARNRRMEFTVQK